RVLHSAAVTEGISPPSSELVLQVPGRLSVGGRIPSWGPTFNALPVPAGLIWRPGPSMNAGVA
ncbi:MAG TPA: hypothetical protein VNB87_00625, partial [Propionibacteriaceae bacterium]|nr:hypothetical protein [Propionibacteriaceae bacterium]